MDPTQYYISVTDGIYGSWRAIGVLEDLQTDGDIAQFLVTLYSKFAQKDGEDSSIRCVHCRSPLTLYCSTCQCPSHLALSTQPPCPSVSTAAPTLPSHGLDTSTTLSVLTDSADTQDLASGIPHTAVKDEAQSAALLHNEGEFDFDNCPVDFGSIKPESPVSAKDCDSSTETAFSMDVLLSGAKGRRKKSCIRKSALTSDHRKKKRSTTASTSIHANKATKRKAKNKNQSTKNNLMRDAHFEGMKKSRKASHVQTEDVINKTVQEDADSYGKIKEDFNNMTLEKQNKEQKKKPNELQDLGDGFVIPVEKRHAAQIHLFDEGFFERHKIEDKPSRCRAVPVNEQPWHKSSTDTGKQMEIVDEEETRVNLQGSEKHAALDGSTSRNSVKNSIEIVESEDTEEQSLKILVSAQKIPPMKTTDGNYTRNLYTYFECLFCKKAFSHKRTFNKHIQTHMEENLYKCNLCSKGFENLYNLKEHERRHKLECDICGKKCTEKNDFHDHMKLHTENNGVMKCPGCTYESTDFYAYRKHKYECAYLRPALQCEICGVHLKSVKSLRHHIAAIHKNDRPYKCTLCEKSFVFKTKLNCHMKYNHAEGGRLFHCDKCGNRFIDPKGLKSHQKSVHSNEKPFRCTYCPSAFARKYTLGVHLRLHTGEKPFRCTECLQAFVQKPSLLLHLKSHHGQDSKVSKKVAKPENSPGT